MLNRDVLWLIFSFLEHRDIKRSRLVCVEWNLLLRLRFSVFYSNKYLPLPDHCDTIVCFNTIMPELHPNIKRAIIYNNVSEFPIALNSSIDFLFIYRSDHRVLIDYNVNEMVIGKFTPKFASWERLKSMTFDSLLRYEIRSEYSELYLTSDKILLSLDDNVTYIKPKTVINRLLIGVRKLIIVDLDIVIGKLCFGSHDSGEKKITVIKNGIKTEHHYGKGLVLINTDILRL